MKIKDSICDWTLTAEQMEVPEHQFCYQVSFFKYQTYKLYDIIKRLHMILEKSL